MGKTHADVLDIGRNQLSSLYNGSFCGLKSLIDLNLSVNKITSLPRGSFACAEKLESINLSLNDIAVLDPQWFDGNHCLSTLRLYQSNIHEIKTVPWNATNLQTLNLANNNLISVNRNTFVGLRNLKFLDLSRNHNPLDISVDAFEETSSLEKIIMKDLVKFTMTAFQDLQKLRNLNLASNYITVIEKQLFSRTSSLQYLYLQNNQISTIDSFTLLPTSLKVLIIANNPFTCTCQLAWFREWLDKVNTTIYQRNETRCSSTSFKSLNNQTIWSFHPEDYCGVNIYLIVGVSLAIVTVLSLSVLVYQKRWWLNHKRFLLKLAIVGYQEIIENQGPEDYEYQLNLMFREDDEWWINDCMKPFLQGRMPHLEHIVFGDSGLHPGSFYLNAIYDVIENSYKTVLLLSNQSVEDTWFMTKLRMAVEHMNDTKLEKIILIFLEDIDDDHLPYLVRLLLSRNKPYLLWVDDDEDAQEFFWAKFEKSMRANREMNNVIPV
eukprot:XP_011675821.1 PREDICTED: toll-like receptor 3 [Strongylocentrotus purpuratus]